MVVNDDVQTRTECVENVVAIIAFPDYREELRSGSCPELDTTKERAGVPVRLSATGQR